MLLWLFQGQIKFQCECALVAAEELNGALARDDIPSIFRALQSILTSTANISKLLWGTQKKTKGRAVAASRLPLRDSLQIKDDSPLLPVVMRNNFEHFDERIDEWWRTSSRRRFADNILLSRAELNGFAPKERFRVFDRDSWDLTFFEDEFNVRLIINEVSRILPLATEAVTRPPRWTSTE